jgi:hypothetical protein
MIYLNLPTGRMLIYPAIFSLKLIPQGAWIIVSSSSPRNQLHNWFLFSFAGKRVWGEIRETPAGIGIEEAMNLICLTPHLAQTLLSTPRVEINFPILLICLGGLSSDGSMMPTDISGTIGVDTNPGRLSVLPL